jgi:hypothetical protein
MQTPSHGREPLIKLEDFQRIAHDVRCMLHKSGAVPRLDQVTLTIEFPDFGTMRAFELEIMRSVKPWECGADTTGEWRRAVGPDTIEFAICGIILALKCLQRTVTPINLRTVGYADLKFADDAIMETWHAGNL